MKVLKVIVSIIIALIILCAVGLLRYYFPLAEAILDVLGILALIAVVSLLFYVTLFWKEPK